MGEHTSFNITYWHNGAYHVSIPNYGGGTVYTAEHVARLTRENEAMRTVLYAAGNALEMIRLDLIENLTEPERSAFWKAVMYRDKIKAVLSSLKEPTDAQA